MEIILRLIRNADVCATPTMLVILYCIGNRMVGNSDRLRRVGIRLGVAALLAYGAFHFVNSPPDTTDAVVFALIHALIAGSLTVVCSWIILSILAFLHRTLVSVPAERAKAAWRTRSEHRRKSDDDARLAEKEFARLEAEDRRKEAERQEAARRSDAKRSRDAARAAVWLAFQQRATNLTGHITREHVEQWIRDFMSENQSVEDVERRRDEFIAMIRDLAPDKSTEAESRTLDDAYKWFDREKERIEQSSADPERKQFQLTELESRFDDVLRERIQEFEP